MPTAAVTTHAKPHAQLQLARDLGGARFHGAALSALKFRRGAARQSAATSMAGFLANCSSAAVQLQKSRVRACDLMPTYRTGRAALSCCRPPISEGHPISMVCSRSGVRLYAATSRSGPGLCAAARFALVKQQGSDGCSGWQDYFFHFFRMLRYE